MLSSKHTGFESVLIFFNFESFSKASNVFVIDAVEEVKEKQLKLEQIEHFHFEIFIKQSARKAVFTSILCAKISSHLGQRKLLLFCAVQLCYAPPLVSVLSGCEKPKPDRARG